jgi:cytochrome c oxidase subunit 2
MTTRIAFYLFLVLAAVIAAVFVQVARSTRRPHDVDKNAANRLRRVFFVGLSAVLLAFLVPTLLRLPYPAEASQADRIIHVTGKQYAFALTDAPIGSVAAWDAGGFPNVVEVAAGTMVEFRVATLDANHGFSLYAPGGDLIAQTQAMPGYVNRLRVRFDRPGTYTVLCLEFCGMGHHRMRGVVEVR